jgi:LacI family transcriptional regulator
VRARWPSRRVSVKDVAARAGVSFQTTSKVLNGKGSVSSATRARILRAAADLAYVPNLQARSLVMQSTRAVGLVASDFSDPNLSRFFAGAEREARRCGYGVDITGLETDGSGGAAALRRLVERRVDGVLLAAPEMEDHQAAIQVLEKTVPIVSLHHLPGGGVATVGADEVSSGTLATRHLVERGHRKIGTVIGPRAREVAVNRLRGYRLALEEAGLAYDDDLVEEGHGTIDGACSAAAAMVGRCPELTAIFAQSDHMAIGVLAAARALGKRVPEDLAVAGCDDIDMAAHTTPPLTTVHVPFEEAGAGAMRLLLDMIATGSASARHLLLPVRLVVRESS